MLTTASAPALAGSYDPATTTAGGFTGEIARLEAQAALSFPEELRILRELGITGPVLELGAGSGAVTRRLVDAGLSVIALDIDPSLLAHAADSGGQLLVGDASAIPLPDASVSSVLIRYVLQHVRSPAAVLAEARRVVRPGGLVALVDVDSAMWGFADPLYAELGGIHAKLAAAQKSAGGDRAIGRRLTRLLRAAGFRDVKLRSFATTNDDHPTEDFAPHLGPERLAPLLASGVLSLREFALAADRWQRFRTDPDAWVMLLGFLAAGRTPEDEGVTP